jgi:beta propeller repeat protein
MKKLLLLMLVGVILLNSAGCAKKPEIVPSAPSESWQIGEHWQYSPQAIWGDTFIGAEYILGDSLTAQYISTYNLSTKEKERLLEFDPAEFRIGTPSIYENWIVWCSANISGKALSEIDWETLNWDIFLLDRNTGEVRQITDDEYVQTEPRVYGDTIIWLDARHVEGYHNPDVFDIYAYDLKTNQGTRLTSSTSVENNFLNISGNIIVWSDNRHAIKVKTHPGNEPNYNNEIYAYDLITNKEYRITDYDGNDHYPAIDGNHIVWLRQFSLNEAEIFLYDLEKKQETQISKGRYAAYGPSVSGDVIVWADARISHGNTSGDLILNGQSGAAEIYLCTIGNKQETMLVPSEIEGEYSGAVFRRVLLNPVAYGDFIVYTHARQIGSITYAMKLEME